MKKFIIKTTLYGISVMVLLPIVCIGTVLIYIDSHRGTKNE